MIQWPLMTSAQFVSDMPFSCKVAVMLMFGWHHYDIYMTSCWCICYRCWWWVAEWVGWYETKKKTYNLNNYVFVQSFKGNTLKTDHVDKFRISLYLLETERKLNVHETFRKHSGRLLNLLCTFSLRRVNMEKLLSSHLKCFSLINSLKPLQNFKW